MRSSKTSAQHVARNSCSSGNDNRSCHAGLHEREPFRAGLAQAALDPCASRTASQAGSSKARVGHVGSVSVACVCSQQISWYRPPWVRIHRPPTCAWEAAVGENVPGSLEPTVPQA